MHNGGCIEEALLTEASITALMADLEQNEAKQEQPLYLCVPKCLEKQVTETLPYAYKYIPANTIIIYI